MSLSSGTLKIGIAAIVVGLIGAYGVRTWLLNNQTPEVPPPQPPQTISVPVASVDLPSDRSIAVGDMVFITVKAEQFLERGWPMEEVMLASGQIIGRQLKSPIKKGDPFLTTGLYLQGEQPNIAKMLKPGERAVRLEVTAESGGNVPAGTFVDLLFRSNPSSKVPEMTLTLLNGIKVLHVFTPALDRRALAVGYRARNPVVTLAVTPTQAKKLRAVAGKGDISLMPIPDSDSDSDFISTTRVALRNDAMTFNEAIGYEPPQPPLPPEPAPEPAPPELHRTVIYKGGIPHIMAFPKSQATPVSLSGPLDIPKPDPLKDLRVTPTGDDGSAIEEKSSSVDLPRKTAPTSLDAPPVKADSNKKLVPDSDVEVAP